VIVSFDPLAAHEFEDAKSFYDRSLEGLGERFRMVVWNAISILEEFPQIGAEIRPGVRRMLLREFPYKLIYVVSEESLQVLAVAHAHRRPEYWIDRAGG